MAALMIMERGKHDAELQRDLSVLSALAHLHWLTTDQLHALCFPHVMLATVRTTLRYFRETGWIHAARWRINACSRSQVWTITATGRSMVERYEPMTVPYRPLDLGRPSTALEHEDYRLQSAVRTFVVQLILEARQQACLARCAVTLPQPAHGGHRTGSSDALVAIVWHSPTLQPAMWLPWQTTALDPAQGTRYPVYLDRGMDVDDLSTMISSWSTSGAGQRCLPLLILHHAERLAAVQHALHTRSRPHAVRLSTWQRLTAGISGNTWLDERGHACSLQPRTTDESGGSGEVAQRDRRETIRDGARFRSAEGA